MATVLLGTKIQAIRHFYTLSETPRASVPRPVETRLVVDRWRVSFRMCDFGTGRRLW